MDCGAQTVDVEEFRACAGDGEAVAEAKMESRSLMPVLVPGGASGGGVIVAVAERNRVSRREFDLTCVDWGCVDEEARLENSRSSSALEALPLVVGCSESVWSVSDSERDASDANPATE